MESRAEKAKRNFEAGQNCCQSVLSAYADLAGLSPDMAMLIGSGLGGGMGRLREVCGAFSGAVIIAGIKKGSLDPTDTAAKAYTYETVQSIAAEFKKTNRSIICRELLGLRDKEETATPSERTAEYYAARPCADIVFDAARALEKVVFFEK